MAICCARAWLGLSHVTTEAEAVLTPGRVVRALLEAPDHKPFIVHGVEARVALRH